MTKVLPTILLLLSACVISAQNPVPNPSLETWTSGKPTGWTASTGITQTAPGHTGSYAALGGKGSLLQPDGIDGFPVSQTYAYLNFYYKFTQVQSEYLSITAMIYDTAAGTSMCSGLDVITSGASSYTLRSVPVSCSAGTPTFCALTFGLDINTGSVPATSPL